MRIRVAIGSMAALLVLGLASSSSAQNTEDTSALRIGYQSTTVECQITNNNAQAENITLTLFNQNGTNVGTQNFPAVPINGIARLTVGAQGMGLGSGSSIWCHADNDTGEISLCLWSTIFTPYLCVTDD